MDAADEGDIGVIINTSMSPWLRAQKTFKRIGFIIRNELYNAYGAVNLARIFIVNHMTIMSRSMMSLNTSALSLPVLLPRMIGMETFLLNWR